MNDTQQTLLSFFNKSNNTSSSSQQKQQTPPQSDTKENSKRNRNQDNDIIQLSPIKKQKINDNESQMIIECKSHDEMDEIEQETKPENETNASLSIMSKAQGDNILFADLCQTLQQLENESKRLLKIEYLSIFYRNVIAQNADDLLHAVYLSVNKLGPSYEGIEIGVGDSLVKKAICETTGKSMKRLKAEIEKVGDIGEVAQSSRSTQKTLFQPPPLTLKKVFDTYKKIALSTGPSTMKRKVAWIKSLMVAAKDIEIRYIVRAVLGQLRIGCNEATVIPALARAVVMTPPSNYLCDNGEIMDASKKMSKEKFEEEISKATSSIKKAFSEYPDWSLIISVLLEQRLEKLNEICTLTPGIPIKSMLAKPTKGIAEIMKRFAEMLFTIEFKYDGERAQIHLLPNGMVKIFSRNSENHTEKYPDLVSVIQDAVKDMDIQSCIIDSEIVAWDRKEEKILPFQVLTTRKRKDVTEASISVQVCIYAFDLLYLNGTSLLEEPFFERRKKLYSNFNIRKGFFDLAIHRDTTEPDEIKDFMQEAMNNSCEGLMVKTLHDHSSYEPDKRSHNWLKVKKDYLEGLTDTMDLVPIGAYRGKGKRTGVYGAFLLACYDNDSEEFQSICKVGTGFKDSDLATLAASLKEIEIENPPSYYAYSKDSNAPDVWFEAKQVWEINAADLSISPVHLAAIGRVAPDKGIALRFPRFVRVREDKNAEDATTAEQISEFYLNQFNNDN